jgi:hypothetical protein
LEVSPSNPKTTKIHNDVLQAEVAPVGGRLKNFASFWRSATTDVWAIDIVENGHSLEFIDKPPLSLRIRWTILKDSTQSLALHEEIQALLEKDAIEVANPETPGFYSHFFVVPKRDGGLRPVLNLKPLNEYITYKKFNMETPASIFSNLRQGMWLASIDLTDAYLHIPIRESHRPYLRFAFGGHTYQFKVLPFGLTSAPRVFTMMLAPIVSLIHREGVQFVPYLDDCLITAPSKQSLLGHIRIAIDLLTQAGFLINLKKSNLTPAQDLIFLGMRLRTDLGSAHLPQEKAQVLARCAETFLQNSVVSAKQCLRFLGLMAAALRVVPQARLLMRPFQIFFLDRWNYKTLPLGKFQFLRL